jgi:hypothetical protein
VVELLALLTKTVDQVEVAAVPEQKMAVLTLQVHQAVVLLPKVITEV